MDDHRSTLVERQAQRAAPHLERDHRRLAAPPDVRDLAKERRLGAPTPRRTCGRLLAIVLLYVAGAAAGLAIQRWWAWVAVWAMQAFLLLAAGAVMHEGVHGNLTGRRGVDRALSFLGGWVIFLPAGAYRPYHLQHHATTISDADPSGANAAPFRNRRHYLLIMVLSGPGFTAQMWGIALRTLVGRPPSYVAERHVRQMRRETMLALGLYAAVVAGTLATGTATQVLAVWVVPAVLGLCVIAPYVLTAEHYGAPMDRPILESTATVDSNRALSWVYLNNNHHTAHHLLSSCNPLRLQEITEQLGDRVDLRHRSYLAFHGDVWRSLSW